MVKLTADLIWKCPHFFNALKKRELDLRGPIRYHRYLSDNEIVKLENFIYLKRLGTLLINNNRVTRINPNIGEFLPSLHTLVLTNNRLVNLVKIDPLSSLPKLQFLSLLYVIHKLKSLRVLDFKKVKAKKPLTCQTYTDKEGIRQQQLLAFIPRHHKHYILPSKSS
ncbi:hypothetical protein ERO13_D11G198700v2 [Gossypium hirsutum]|uniref:U2A'/phosphoprotein 32 family A C-terminal domain-containing protein n=1 Tax=Gossypium tomentosum TaxID=34277 RepID=A0A5D2IQF8_GOSTO|nr:hypothetical protein ERO13_D11G198700v2 [Gossypium hirsutum]TYH44811.1 hypothetical protein ES332_D11G220700v1 [Gossypium tomentosum]